MKLRLIALFLAIAVALPAWAHRTVLTWSPSNGATGYNVYRSSAAGTETGTSPINSGPIAGTSYSDASVADGQTYYYVVTALEGGLESSFSSEVKAIIPTPATQASVCWQFTSRVTSSTSEGGAGIYSLTIPDGVWVKPPASPTALTPVNAAITVTLGIPPMQETLVPIAVTGCAETFSSEDGCQIVGNFAYSHGPGTLIQINGCV